MARRYEDRGEVVPEDLQEEDYVAPEPEKEAEPEAQITEKADDGLGELNDMSSEGKENLTYVFSLLEKRTFKARPRS